MQIEKAARETLTAVELDVGDELRFVLADGTARSIVLEKTRSRVHETNLKERRVPEPLGRTVCRCHVDLRIDGRHMELVRWIGCQMSFYAPWELAGLRLWFDGTADLFEHLTENHGACKPRRAARFAVQDATRRIAPVLLHPWCPLPAGGLRIEDCYEGGDCWMGPYFGAEAHGGLDINHPAGTPIWTPIAMDDHALFDRIEAGASNNRWRGTHRWRDGAMWTLQVHHVIGLRVPEHEPLPAGTLLADGAGVHVGSREHSHFVFEVLEPGAREGEEILLDPWILFWQMYQDRRDTTAP